MTISFNYNWPNPIKKIWWTFGNNSDSGKRKVVLDFFVSQAGKSFGLERLMKKTGLTQTEMDAILAVLLEEKEVLQKKMKLPGSKSVAKIYYFIESENIYTRVKLRPLPRKAA